VPAGRYYFILDAIIVDPVDVTFALLWRSTDGDRVIAEWTAHYEPLPGRSFEAQPCEHDVDGPTITAGDGDELVFRYSASATSPPAAYIPNGDGAKANGRISSFTLPP
jgi:hypothetical protein